MQKDAGCDDNRRTPRRHRDPRQGATATSGRSPDIRTPLPGPKARQHVAFDHTYTSPSLPRAYPLVPVRGEGAAIEDIDGNLFLDFTAGIAVSSTGYSHPRITAAIERQANKLLHFSASDFYLPVYASWPPSSTASPRCSGPTRAFFTNSGAEAVEAAIKLARFALAPAVPRRLLRRLPRPHLRRGQPDRIEVAATTPASGRCCRASYHVPFGSAGLDELEQRVFKQLVPADEVAAIFVEPIQGEGGYLIPDADFLPAPARAVRRHGILLVADEVQSGIGRTGKMWAIEHWGVEPDILLPRQGHRLRHAARRDDRQAPT